MRVAVVVLFWVAQPFCSCITPTWEGAKQTTALQLLHCLMCTLTSDPETRRSMSEFVFWKSLFLSDVFTDMAPHVSERAVSQSAFKHHMFPLICCIIAYSRDLGISRYFHVSRPLSIISVGHIFYAILSLPCRIESYSCKMAGDDKHMFKQFCQEGEPHVLEALSPPQSTSTTSPSQWVVQPRVASYLQNDS